MHVTWLRVWALLLICNLLFKSSFACISSRGDSTDYKVWANFKAYKAKKSRQIKTVETPTHKIIYGADKKRNHITTVQVHDRLAKEQRTFFYNEKGLFQVLINSDIPSGNGMKRRHGRCIYCFESGRLFYRKEEGLSKTIDPLLTEANRLLAEGQQFL